MNYRDAQLGATVTTTVNGETLAGRIISRPRWTGYEYQVNVQFFRPVPAQWVPLHKLTLLEDVR